MGARRTWLVPVGLVLLSAVPVVAGAVRLEELGSGPVVTPANARFVASPVPVVVHIVGATLYCLLGATQFSAGLRRRHPTFHRRLGRVLVPCGLAAALSGLWMALTYPRPWTDAWVLTPMRLVFGTAMAACLVLGVRAILRRDVRRHRAWMARAYAIGLGAGTQVLTHVPLFVLGETPHGTPRAIAMLAGWLVNLAVVEVALRRSTGRRSHPVAAPTAPVSPGPGAPTVA